MILCLNNLGNNKILWNKPLFLDSLENTISPEFEDDFPDVVAGETCFLHEATLASASFVGEVSDDFVLFLGGNAGFPDQIRVLPQLILLLGAFGDGGFNGHEGQVADLVKHSLAGSLS